MDFINLVWIIEQLFSFQALRSLVVQKEKFQQLFEKAESVHFLIRSVDELCAFCASESAQDEPVCIQSSSENKELATAVGNKRKLV